MEDAVRQMRALAPTVDLRADSMEDAETALEFMRNEYPTLFHVGDVALTYDAKNKVARLTPKYLFSKAEYDGTMKEVLEALKPLREDMAQMKTDEEKELYIHDYLCQTITYNETAEDLDHTIVYPLLDGIGVCDGISKLAHELFHLAGIRSHVLVGKTKDSDGGFYGLHAWNIARVNGVWHHDDFTFDCGLSAFGLRYDYFRLSTEELEKTHKVLDTYKPFAKHCVPQPDWFEQNGLVFGSMTAIEQHISSCLREKQHVVYFRLSDPSGSITEKAVNDCFQQHWKATKKRGYNVFRPTKGRNVFHWRIE